MYYFVIINRNHTIDDFDNAIRPYWIEFFNEELRSVLEKAYRLDLSGSGGDSGSTGSNCSGDTGERTTTPSGFKYPDGLDYATKYPKLTEYLKNKLKNVIKNEPIKNALKKWGHLTDEQIIKNGNQD